MGEVRNALEGSLAWVQASGSGTAWATASAATGRVFSYVRNMSWTSGETIQAVMDRGIPTHNKLVNKQAIQVSCTVAYGATAEYPTNASGSGASVPMVHLELKQKAPEVGSGSGVWYQFFGVPVSQLQFNEGDNENTLALTLNGLAMNGPTASGYLIT